MMSCFLSCTAGWDGWGLAGGPAPTLLGGRLSGRGEDLLEGREGALVDGLDLAGHGALHVALDAGASDGLAVVCPGVDGGQGTPGGAAPWCDPLVLAVPVVEFVAAALGHVERPRAVGARGEVDFEELDPLVAGQFGLGEGPDLLVEGVGGLVDDVERAAHVVDAEVRAGGVLDADPLSAGLAQGDREG